MATFGCDVLEYTPLPGVLAVFPSVAVATSKVPVLDHHPAGVWDPVVSCKDCTNYVFKCRREVMCWGPAGLCKNCTNVVPSHSREAEMKHGRITTLATIGCNMLEYTCLPGVFDFFPNGAAAIPTVPALLQHQVDMWNPYGPSKGCTNYAFVCRREVVSSNENASHADVGCPSGFANGTCGDADRSDSASDPADKPSSGVAPVYSHTAEVTEWSSAALHAVDMYHLLGLRNRAFLAWQVLADKL